MNYIKKALLLFSIFISLTAWAEETVLNTTAGNLASAIAGNNLANIDDLKLTGSVNATDFFFIRDNIKDIKSIDMSEVRIEACEIDGVSYPANEIPANAFYVPLASSGLSRLNTFYFPITIESIGENAFYQVTNLRYTNLGELPSLRVIKSAAISRCTRLREIEIPASVEEIGVAAFAYNQQLNKVSIASGSRLSLLGNNAFNGCSLISSLDFSETLLVEIGKEAFNACSQLNSIALPATVETIGDEAFMYTAINQIDWSHLSKLSVIEGSMFYGVGSLQSVVLPLGIKEIKASAFTLCKGMSSISLPYNLTTIGDWAFANCTALRTIVCPTPAVPTVGYQAFQGVNTANVNVEVLESIISQYENDAIWSTFSLKGNPFTGLHTTHHNVAQVLRSANCIEVVSPTMIGTITLYSYNGNILHSYTVNSTHAVIEYAAHTRCIMRIGYTNGDTEVVKL